jgi:PTS system N-acetylglucosamine-specific IIC component
LQVVLGPIADGVAMEMRAAAGPLAAVPVAQAALPQAATVDPAPWLAALGGRANVAAAGAASSRIWLDLADPARVDEVALGKLGVRMIAQPSPDTLQLIIDDAEAIAAGLQPA